MGNILESEEPKRSRSKKSSTKPEPKLIKYPNGSKFWFLENRNRSEPKYFGYLNVSEIDLYTYIYINYF